MRRSNKEGGYVYQRPGFTMCSGLAKARPETKTEQLGFVSLRDRLVRIMQAGERLQIARESYEFGDGDPIPSDYFGDPTRRPGFDVADAQVLLETKAAKLQAAKDAAKAAKVKAKADVQEADAVKVVAAE